MITQWTNFAAVQSWVRYRSPFLHCTRMSAVVWKLTIRHTGMTCWKRHPSNCDGAIAEKLMTVESSKNFVACGGRACHVFLLVFPWERQKLWDELWNDDVLGVGFEVFWTGSINGASSEKWQRVGLVGTASFCQPTATVLLARELFLPWRWRQHLLPNVISYETYTARHRRKCHPLLKS
jgi:hypothetical protein